jgi:hypothetical protein
MIKLIIFNPSDPQVNPIKLPNISTNPTIPTSKSIISLPISALTEHKITDVNECHIECQHNLLKTSAQRSLKIIHASLNSEHELL